MKCLRWRPEWRWWELENFDIPNNKLALSALLSYIFSNFFNHVVISPTIFLLEREKEIEKDREEREKGRERKEEEREAFQIIYESLLNYVLHLLSWPKCLVLIPCTLHALVSHVPLALLTLVFHVSRALREFASHVPRSLCALVSYLLRALHALEPHMHLALFLLVPLFPRSLPGLVSHVSRASCTLCSTHSCLAWPLCLVPCALHMSSSLAFSGLVFPCFTYLFLIYSNLLAFSGNFITVKLRIICG